MNKPADRPHGDPATSQELQRQRWPLPRHLGSITAIAALILALALLPLPLGLLALMAALPICLITVEPVISLYLAILSVPIQETILLPGGASMTQAAMLVLVFHCALSLLARPQRHLHAGRLLPLWLLFLWVLVLATALTPYSQIEGLKETLRWAEAFAIWLIAVNLVRRPWHLAGLLICLLLAPVSEALYGLFQFATGAGPPSFRIAPGSPYVRAYGTIGQPNSFAAYLNMGWPLALALAVGLTIRAGQLRSSAWLWMGAAVCWGSALALLAGLGVSFSRGAWVGAAFGLLAMALALGRRARWAALAALMIALAALGLGGAGWLPAPIAGRMASITRYTSLFDAGAATVTPENFAVVERMAHMQAGWGMFRTHPLIGVGPGNFSTAYPFFAVGQWYISRGHAHNYYLNLAAELGVVGLVAYLALLGGILRQLLITLRCSTQSIWRSAAIGCCGIIAAAIGHDLFENVHVLSLGIQLAAVWALIDRLEYFEKHPQNQPTRLSSF